MICSRIFTLTIAAALAVGVSDAQAQHRGAAHPGGRAGGGGVVVGRAAPRGVVASGRPVVVAPGHYAPRVVGYAPYRPYYYPYRHGVTVGFYANFGYPYPYGYPYGVGVSVGYGYPYRYGYPYPYPYPYAYPYPYPAYGGYGYPLPPAGYVTATPGAAYGGVHIEGAPPDGQVFVDGYYMGVVDDFDGPTQHLNLQSGPHRVEIRLAGGVPPIAFDVNVQPGQTTNVHAGMP